MTKRKLADIYRRAAKSSDRVSRDGGLGYMCVAIETIVGDGIVNPPPCGLLFQVTKYPNSFPTTPKVIEFVLPYESREFCNQMRVMLLLLMTEWVMTDWDGVFP